MGRTLLCCFAGAGIGFFLAFVLAVMTRLLFAPDAGAIFVFVGVFLAGTGAIAGAVIGGAAELLAFLKTKEQSRQAQEQDKSKSEASGSNKRF